MQLLASVGPIELASVLVPFALIVLGSVVLAEAWERLGPRSSPGRRRRRRPHASTVSRRRRVEVLAGALTRGQLQSEGGMHRVGGLYRGRQVRLATPIRGDEEGFTFELDVANTLCLTVAAHETAEGRATYTTDLTGLDPRERGLAEQLLHRPAVRRALGALFVDWEARSLELVPGALRVELPPDEFSLVPERAKRVLRTLATIARAVVQTRERLQEQPRPAAVAADPDGLAGRHCPYCRDELRSSDGGAEEELAACEQCQAVHHAECFAEFGRCTAFGCEGRRCVPLVDGAAGARAAIRLTLEACPECGSRTRDCLPGLCRAPRGMLERMRSRWSSPASRGGARGWRA